MLVLGYKVEQKGGRLGRVSMVCERRGTSVMCRVLRDAACNALLFASLRNLLLNRTNLATV